MLSTNILYGLLQAPHDVLHAGELPEPRQLAEHPYRLTHLPDVFFREGRLRDGSGFILKWLNNTNKTIF